MKKEINHGFRSLRSRLSLVIGLVLIAAAFIIAPAKPAPRTTHTLAQITREPDCPQGGFPYYDDQGTCWCGIIGSVPYLCTQRKPTNRAAVSATRK